MVLPTMKKYSPHGNTNMQHIVFNQPHQILLLLFTKLTNINKVTKYKMSSKIQTHDTLRLTAINTQ